MTLAMAVVLPFLRWVYLLSTLIIGMRARTMGSFIILQMQEEIGTKRKTSSLLEAIISMVILGVFPTAIATLLYFRIVANLGASTMSQVNYIIPILGAIWGVIFLGEAMRATTIFALIMVLLGLAIVNHSRNKKN